MSTDYSDYTIPICDAPEYYGVASKVEAVAFARRIEQAAKIRFPGVRTYLFGVGHHQTRITGPDSDVRDAMQMWLAVQ